MPGVVPLGSSSTLRCPQAKLLLFPHVVYAICALAEATDGSTAGAQNHAASATSTAASAR